MTQECTLKEAFIMKKLDELQPNWRTGEDVVWATKNMIKEYVEEHYSEILSPTESACITFNSIEKTIMRIRKKLDIQAKKRPHNTEREVTWQQLPKQFISPVRERSNEEENKNCECDTCTCEQEPELETEPERKEAERHIDLVPIACTNPDCDKFALVTPQDKRLYFVTYPLRKGKFVRPYCSEECQQAHSEMLKIT